MNKHRLGAYFHIPFCDTKCVYCDFFSITNHSQSEKFYSAIEKEIHLFFEKFKVEGPVTSVYFGGGTPSLADPKDLAACVSGLKKYLPFDPNLEVTLEANPGTLTNEKLKSLVDFGFNRISMGVQSFFEEDLKFLDRIHSADQAKNAVFQAKQNGFQNISIDLIFGLPKQSLENWKQNLEQAVKLPISHISCYNLIVEENTPLWNYVQSGKVKILPEVKNEELYEFTIEFLKSEGFEQYEVSNFCKPGFESLHNSTYWSYDNYLAFGPSAHGFLNGNRYFNGKNLTKYIEMIENGQLPHTSSELIAGKTMINEKLMLSLRISSGVGIQNIWKELSETEKKTLTAKLDKYKNQDLLIWNNDLIQPTEKGIRFADSIAEDLFI